MKIKKYFKVILSFMAFVLFSFAFAINPTVQAYAEEAQAALTNCNLAFNAIKMPKKTVNVAEGQKLEMPLLTDDSLDYTIRVIDPAGQKHDYVVGSSESNPYFTLSGSKLTVNSLNNGTYDIVYIVKDSSKTYYSNTYSVVVKNVSYSLDFAATSGANAGLKTLLPANMKKSDSAVTLPVGYVNKILGEDTEATSDKASITVMWNGIKQVANAEGSVYTTEGDNHYLTPSKEGTYTIEYSYNKGSNPPTKTFTVTVTEDFVAPTSKDLTITTPTLPTVELGDTEVTLPKLTVSDNLNDNVEYNLKSITITNSNDSNITKTLTNNDYTFDMTKEFFGVDSYKDLVGNYEIAYNIEDAYGNTKSITVVLKNVKDNTKPSVYMAYDYDVTVTDGVKTVDDDKVNTNYAVDLKAKYGYGELVLPAIYAKDKVSAYNDYTFVRYIQNTNTKTIYYVDNKKMEDGQLVDVNSGEEGYNYSADANIGNYNKAVTFKFVADDGINTGDASKYAGEYTVGYYVVANTTEKQENYVYSTGTTRYSFTVLNTANVANTDDSNISIEINNLKNNSSINSDATINVNVTSKDEDKNDTRLKNAVFYYYSTTSGNTLSADITTAINAVKSDSTSDYHNHKCNILDDTAFVNKMIALGYSGFSIVPQDEDNAQAFNATLNNYTNQANVTIVAVTINDYANTAIDTRTLNINDLEETNAPTYSITSYGDFVDSGAYVADKEFDQAESVTLPTVKFTDLEDSSLAMSVMYYIDEPDTTDTGLQFKSPTGKQFAGNTIVGGKINTTKVGTYYVVYTAVDDAGNSNVVYFTFKVVDSSDPILTVGVSGDDIKYSGNTITGDIGSVISFDPALYMSDGTTDITHSVGADISYKIDDGDKGLDYAPTGEDMTFVFNDEGEYTITFKGKYNGKTAIEKVINISISMPKLAWDFEISPKKTATRGETVTLPELTATQGNKKAVVSVKVTDPDGQEVEVEQVYVDEATVWQFTTDANAKGTYKVVYTAKTDTSTITQSYEIKVGDNVPPTFVMQYEKELSQSIVYDGENNIEYSVKLNKTNRKLVIVATSNGKEIYSYDTNLVIKDQDDNGTSKTLTSWSKLTVEFLKDGTVVDEYATDDNNSNYKTYTISSTGTYTLRLTMSDSYNNEAVKDIKFNVVTKTEAKEDNDTVIGAVLIVISLVILAGVILFFTFTGKKGSGKKSSRRIKNTKSETKVKEEKVEETAEDTTEEDNTTTDTESNADEAKEGEVE